MSSEPVNHDSQIKELAKQVEALAASHKETKLKDDVVKELVKEYFMVKKTIAIPVIGLLVLACAGTIGIWWNIPTRVEQYTSEAVKQTAFSKIAKETERYAEEAKNSLSSANKVAADLNKRHDELDKLSKSQKESERFSLDFWEAETLDDRNNNIPMVTIINSKNDIVLLNYYGLCLHGKYDDQNGVYVMSLPALSYALELAAVTAQQIAKSMNKYDEAKDSIESIKNLKDYSFTMRPVYATVNGARTLSGFSVNVVIGNAKKSFVLKRK